jgi:GntR family transcriptional regulator
MPKQASPSSSTATELLDPADNSPMYLKVARKLMRDVQAGHYASNQALPSERALSEQFGVSRVTARKAIDQLAQHGMVIRRQGSGNYVSQVELPLSSLSGFTAQISQRGHRPNSTWLKRQVVVANAEEQMSLGLSSNTQVVRLERLRMADDEVLAHELTVLPLDIVPHPEAIENSLYEYLGKTGNLPVRALQQIRAANATQKIADWLGVEVGQAVLYVTQVGYLASGRPVELCYAYCRSLNVAQTPTY